MTLGGYPGWLAVTMSQEVRLCSLLEKLGQKVDVVLHGQSTRRRGLPIGLPHQFSVEYVLDVRRSEMGKYLRAELLPQCEPAHPENQYRSELISVVPEFEVLFAQDFSD